MNRDSALQRNTVMKNARGFSRAASTAADLVGGPGAQAVRGEERAAVDVSCGTSRDGGGAAPSSTELTR
jgi:hypothetical protein